MALTADQIEKIDAAAEEAGVDPDALRAAAEEELANPETGAKPSGGEAESTSTSKRNDTKLYLYLLPFVRVREVRAILRAGGLPIEDGAFPGDGEVASVWAAAHPVDGSSAAASPGAGDGTGTEEPPEAQ